MSLTANICIANSPQPSKPAETDEPCHVQTCHASKSDLTQTHAPLWDNGKTGRTRVCTCDDEEEEEEKEEDDDGAGDA